MRCNPTLMTLLIMATLVAPPCGWAAAALADPIAEKIAPGEILARLEPFVRAPRSSDSTGAGGMGATNAAWARIQYLKPIPDGSGRLVFNDTRGLLYLTDQEGSEPTVFLDLRKYGGFGFDDSMFPNETGLAGFAFHPDFARAGSAGYGRFYTAYSARSDGGRADYLDDDAASHESVIREWTMADPGTNRFSGASREVFRIGQFAPNHNIGTLGFDPTVEPGTPDYGLLYACLGDGGAANDPRDFGQSLSVPHGAIIRIDPLAAGSGRGYGIPAGNPFRNRTDAAGEIWAYGLRHPQHFSWAGDGRMFIADIGQNQVEEINQGRAGANYGWRLREGTFATAYGLDGAHPGPVYPLPEAPDPRFVDPIAQYDHDEGNAVSGVFLYEGKALPALQGKLVFSDLVRGRLFYADPPETNAIAPATVRSLRLVIDGREQALSEVAGMANTYAPGQRVDLRLARDAAGELYLLTKSDGWIRALVPVD